MPKKEKKSIVDFIEESTVSPEKIDQAVNDIHQISSKKEKTYRVTVDTPEHLHKQLKKYLIDADMSLQSFYLQAVIEKFENLSK